MPITEFIILDRNELENLITNFDEVATALIRITDIQEVHHYKTTVRVVTSVYEHTLEFKDEDRAADVARTIFDEVCPVRV